jgi:hypothetical protein
MRATAGGLAICVAGMHRSGTSMVARILAECGVYLGEPNELLPPAADNVAGHVEHREFVQLSDEVLANARRRLGRRPAAPCRLAEAPARPASRAGRRARRPDAAARAVELEGSGTSLTLPFWLDVVPDLRIVVCVRDVVAVAHSLLVRDHSSELFGMRLWAAYNRRLLAEAPRGRTS